MARHLPLYRLDGGTQTDQQARFSHQTGCPRVGAGAASKVVELTKTISAITRQLDQYRSIRGQLNMGSLQQENKELRQRKSFYKSIIEQHGPAYLLGVKKELRQTRDVL